MNEVVDIYLLVTGLPVTSQTGPVTGQTGFRSATGHQSPVTGQPEGTSNLPVERDMGITPTGPRIEIIIGLGPVMVITGLQSELTGQQPDMTDLRAPVTGHQSPVTGLSIAGLRPRQNPQLRVRIQP